MRNITMSLVLSAAMTATAATDLQAPADSVVSIAVEEVVLPLSETQEIVLTLQECLDIALSSNPSVKVADMEITRLDYSKKETLGQLLPSVSFGATYNRMIAKQVAYMNMSALGSFGGAGSTPEGSGTEGTDGEVETPAPAKTPSKGIKMGLDNSWSVGFSASVPLIAPQLWKTLKLSDSQILESYETARSSRLSLVNEVKSAYYTLLLALDSYNVILESYDMAKFTASLYEKKFAVGAASEYDVLRTQVAVQNIEPELMQSEIAIRQAKLKLLILMGMPPTLEFTVADRLQQYESTMYETALSFDRDNISGNSDLRLFDIRRQQLDNALDIKKMSWLPTLSLTAMYNWTSSSNGSPLANFRWTPYSVVGLTFTLPLYVGGQRYYSYKQTEVQIGEMVWQRENLVNSINMQVELAMDNINKNIRQISSTGSTVKQAEKAHDIMQRSFEIGAASYLDLRDSELALTRSRLGYYESIYNYLVACSNLELLLGNAPVQNFMPAR